MKFLRYFLFDISIFDNLSYRTQTKFTIFEKDFASFFAMRKTLILLFFLFLFTKSSNSVQNEYKHLEESNNNVSYEIPVDDDKTIIFKGTGIITVSIAKAAQNKKKIIIEEGITEIENKAFYQSSLRRKDEEFNYEEVELPCSLVRIGYLSFKTQGHELKTVHFPKIDSKSDPESFYSLREIGDYAFSGQPLIEHNIPNTFIELGNNAFESSQLKHIERSERIWVQRILRLCFTL